MAKKKQAVEEESTIRDSGLSKADEEKLVLQCLEEYDHAIKYRQKREPSWKLVDDLYYGKKKKSIISRANVHIPVMQGTIDTFLAKIDDEPQFRYEPVEESDQVASEQMTALIKRQANVADWGFIDLLGKKEAALYGRANFKKFADNSNKEYKDFHEYVDILDFYIDPLAGGLDPMGKANYVGQDNIIKSIYDLEGNKNYDQDAVLAIKDSMAKIQNDNTPDANAAKQARRQSLNLSSAVLYSDESTKCIEHYTTFKGKRYQAIIAFEQKVALRIKLLREIFSSNEFPFYSWAVFPRANEFWTPGVGELVMEVNIIKNVLTSQVLDNNAYRNYGMKAFDIAKVQNPNDLTPRPMGRVAVTGDPNVAIKDISFPDITNSLTLLNYLDSSFAKESGVTDQSKGMPHSKRMSATEFAGLIDEVADRFFSANRSYKYALRRLAMLFHQNVIDFMNQKTKVRILGARGMEWVEMDKESAKGNLDIIISSGVVEQSNRDVIRDRFSEYRTRNAENPRLNQHFLDEKEARLQGIEDYELERLMSPNMEESYKELAEASRENELMLSREVTENLSATMAHIQRHLDYVRTTETLTPKQRARILAHANKEVDIAIRNEELKATQLINERKRELSINIVAESQVSTPPVQPQLPAQPPTMNIPQAQIANTSLNPESIRQQAITNAP